MNAYLRKLILEISRYEEKTGTSEFEVNEIRSFVKPPGQETHAFTMTNFEKIGLNPRTGFNTPAGVYFYPLNDKYFDMLMSKTLPFAGDRDFVGVVELNEINNPDKWLVVSSNSNSYAIGEIIENSIDWYNNTIEEKINFDPRYEWTVDYFRRNGKHWGNNASSKVFDITYLISKNASLKSSRQPTVLWTSLLRSLGFIGVKDDGDGTIHPSERDQLVCLDKRAYNIVNIYKASSIYRTDSFIDSKKTKKNIEMIFKNAKGKDGIKLANLIKNELKKSAGKLDFQFYVDAMNSQIDVIVREFYEHSKSAVLNGTDNDSFQNRQIELLKTSIDAFNMLKFDDKDKTRYIKAHIPSYLIYETLTQSMKIIFKFETDYSQYTIDDEAPFQFSGSKVEEIFNLQENLILTLAEIFPISIDKYMKDLNLEKNVLIKRF